MSSHGLALHRVDGTRFKAAIFTNLTQDHLDFHADLDDYWLAKRRLLPAFRRWRSSTWTTPTGACWPARPGSPP